MNWKILGYRLLGAGVIILNATSVVYAIRYVPDPVGPYTLVFGVIGLFIYILLMAALACWFIHKAGRSEWEHP